MNDSACLGASYIAMAWIVEEILCRSLRSVCGPQSRGLIVCHDITNLFFLDLAKPAVVIAVKSLKPRTMAINGQEKPTHLVNKNKHIEI